MNGYTIRRNPVSHEKVHILCMQVQIWQRNILVSKWKS